MRPEREKTPIDNGEFEVIGPVEIRGVIYELVYMPDMEFNDRGELCMSIADHAGRCLFLQVGSDPCSMAYMAAALVTTAWERAAKGEGTGQPFIGDEDGADFTVRVGLAVWSVRLLTGRLYRRDEGAWLERGWTIDPDTREITVACNPADNVEDDYEDRTILAAAQAVSEACRLTFGDGKKQRKAA